jgi:protein-tyrosine-phosphatase
MFAAVKVAEMIGEEHGKQAAAKEIARAKRESETRYTADSAGIFNTHERKEVPDPLRAETMEEKKERKKKNFFQRKIEERKIAQLQEEIKKMSREQFLADLLQREFGWVDALVESAREKWNTSEDMGDVSLEGIEDDVNPSECGRYYTVDSDIPTDPETLLKLRSLTDLPLIRDEEEGDAYQPFVENVAENKEEYYVPGIEYLKLVRERPDEIDLSLKDGHWHALPGTLLRAPNGGWAMFRFRWLESQKKFKIGAYALSEKNPYVGLTMLRKPPKSESAQIES